MKKNGCMRLLVVEDDPQLQKNLAQGLTEEGYKVDTASDGEEGLYHLQQFDYAAAILDIMLPKLDGWQIIARIRDTNPVPILILTARDSVDDRIRGLDSGADDYLPKPFHLDELYSRIRALIRRSRGAPNPVLSHGDLSIDTLARSITKSGVPVPLTNIEYSISEALLTRPGQVVSRSFLYENLFGEDDDNISDSLYVHICRLRKKLGKDVIKTRPGQGYYVDSES
ncbi:response regulator transcription factor [Pelagicoccus sp. SDUM812003]|uniref:response regulator transcription factor n=1 Tax=Pelagicoccus sp. SDUM812003 TaxID=3041267 RepID=UPI00280E6BDC|nr:response regulator transcription factor [Pelagicoccus sp. SDUM812003]MDQ8204101.1 response regulator transcription factor [Pelagicoccus sp. SDUM812003]